MNFSEFLSENYTYKTPNIDIKNINEIEEYKGNIVVDKSNAHLFNIEGKLRKIIGNVKIVDIDYIPLIFKSITVDGSFVHRKFKLKSLENSPSVITGHFNVSNNLLTTLEFGPKEVGGDYLIYLNKLVTLKGCPEKLYGEFRAYTNLKLESLDFICKEFYGSVFNISNTGIVNITTLPQFNSDVKFDFRDTKITDLSLLSSNVKKVKFSFMYNDLYTDVLGDLIRNPFGRSQITDEGIDVNEMTINWELDEIKNLLKEL